MPAIESSLDFFNTLREITSSNEEVAIADIATVYPNPASSELFIADNQEEIVSVSIYDLNGRLNLTQDYPSSRIDLNNLMSGMYILQLKTADKIAATKLVVE